jgi:hypothetical protein
VLVDCLFAVGGRVVLLLPVVVFVRAPMSPASR